MQITSVVPGLLLLLGAARPARAAPLPRTQDLVFTHGEPEERDAAAAAAGGTAAPRGDKNDGSLAERKQTGGRQDEEAQEKLPRRSLLEPPPAARPQRRLVYYEPDARDVAEAAARRARLQAAAQRAFNGSVEAPQTADAERESVDGQCLPQRF